MWYIMPKSVTVSIEVPNARSDVFAFLDVMANHEPFTNHMLFDWSYSGPPSGLGAQARAHSKAGGRVDTIDIEVVDADVPARIVERNVSAGGRRVGEGTYELAERPGGATQISFTYAWLRAPLVDRALAPLARTVLRRGNQRAMERLAEQLSQTTVV
jgi:polyketide cyclase/dehydrase/lipid transport protein